jgi:hypothetical protein
MNRKSDLSSLALLSLALLASPDTDSIAKGISESGEKQSKTEQVSSSAVIDEQVIAYNEMTMAYPSDSGSGYPRPQQGGGRGITSMAIGEEGGGGYPRPRYNPNNPQNMQTLTYPEGGMGYQQPQRLKPLPPNLNRPNNNVYFRLNPSI